jgi:hypothetical protein
VPAALTKSQRDLVEAYRLGLGPRAAARLTADQLRDAAMAAAARVDAEIARMQRTGALKSVNKSYRDYRLAAAARGERTLPYAAWLRRYKAGLVREIAATLRSL